MIVSPNATSHLARYYFTLGLNLRKVSTYGGGQLRSTNLDSQNRLKTL
jgi:hypothetical protein